MSEKNHPWNQSMPKDQFSRMEEILSAPSPIGLEAAMTEGVLVPMLEQFIPEGWKIHRFRGNAGIVVDTMPDAPEGTLTVMAIGHADKIRMQVRSIGDDGKIWINSDSFLPTTLIGHEEACGNLAETTNLIMDSQPVAHLVTVGGDTSSAVLRSLDIKGFDVSADDIADLPRGDTWYAGHPMTYIAKPAGFSKSSILAEIAETLVPRRKDTPS